MIGKLGCCCTNIKRWRTRESRFCFKLLVIVVLIILFSYTLLEQNASTVSLEHWGKTGPHFQIFDEVIWKNSSSKTILLWTTFFMQYWFVDEINGRLRSCPYNCTATMDRKAINSSDLIWFHSLDLFFFVQGPRYRSRDQIWLLYGMEPPTQLNIFGGYLRRWRHKFNWTMNYREDSTVFSPYGSIRNVTQSEKENRKSLDLDIAKTKTKLVMALVSNCIDDSGRNRLIRNIQKYLKLDFYGFCGDLTCGKNDPKCGDVFKRYKFVLAFENSHCRDYVSEKFWFTLHEGNRVPIVNWKDPQKGQRKHAPPNSYINVFDFSNIKQFANYIKMLDTNNTLYNSFFEWRRNYAINLGISHKFCELCKALHYPRKAQTLIDPAKWIDDDACERWSLPNILDRIWDFMVYKMGFW